MTSKNHVFVGGCCGSRISFRKDRFSRLTTSIGVVQGKRGIMFDQGHGARNVAEHFEEQGVTEVMYLQSHYHPDHTEGLSTNWMIFKTDIKQLGFFAPLVGEGIHVAWRNAFGHKQGTKSPAPIEIREFSRKDDAGLSDFGISTCMLRHPGGNVAHPGGSVAYRIATDRGDVVIASDHEPGDPTYDEGYAQFVDGARLLLADVQYRQREYDGHLAIGNNKPRVRHGIGHGTPETLAGALKQCRRMPQSVGIIHHHPDRPESDMIPFGVEANHSLLPLLVGTVFSTSEGKSYRL